MVDFTQLHPAAALCPCDILRHRLFSDLSPGRAASSTATQSAAPCWADRDKAPRSVSGSLQGITSDSFALRPGRAWELMIFSQMPAASA